MRSVAKALVWIVGGWVLVAGLVALYFADNIRGYYRFRQYCEQEGGLRVMALLEPGVGWTADRLYATTPALLPQVAFVRFTGKDGTRLDMKYVGGHPGREASYRIERADPAKQVVYQWMYINESLPSELRLGRSGYKIFDLRNNRLVATYYYFGYSKFDQDKTILAAPSGESCKNEPGQMMAELKTRLFSKSQ
jgi:hypothetical protein